MNDASRPPLVYKPPTRCASSPRRPVRRPRRVDQHHAAHPAGVGLRGDPPRPQPLGRRDRQRALQEDAHGIAITSYQGGHVEFFKYMVDLLRERGGAHIKVFGGGGGVIVPAEIERAARLRRRAHLHARGRPALGLAGHDRRDRAARDADLRAHAAGVARRAAQGRRASSARARWRGSSPGSRTARCPRSCVASCWPPRRKPRSPCSASPAPAARARAR